MFIILWDGGIIKNKMSERVGWRGGAVRSPTFVLISIKLPWTVSDSFHMFQSAVECFTNLMSLFMQSRRSTVILTSTI